MPVRRTVNHLARVCRHSMQTPSPTSHLAVGRRATCFLSRPSPTLVLRLCGGPIHARHPICFLDTPHSHALHSRLFAFLRRRRVLITLYRSRRHHLPPIVFAVTMWCCHLQPFASHVERIPLQLSRVRRGLTPSAPLSATTNLKATHPLHLLDAPAKKRARRRTNRHQHNSICSLSSSAVNVHTLSHASHEQSAHEIIHDCHHHFHGRYDTRHFIRAFVSPASAADLCSPHFVLPNSLRYSLPTFDLLHLAAWDPRLLL